METRRFSVIGGDLRFCEVARALRRSGAEVTVYGFETAPAIPDVHVAPDARSAVRAGECIVLPLPFSTDQKIVNLPFGRETVEAEDLLSWVSPSQLVLGGRMPQTYFALAGRRGFRLIDYFDREELAVENAIPTAEGAIAIAMEELPITLHGAHAVVTGFGRVAQALCERLAGLRAHVTVAARSFSALARIDAAGFTPCPFGELREVLPAADVVFNTVPTHVFDAGLLALLPHTCVVIDLASRPGGVELDDARALGVPVIWALSLPGKCAPVTAGRIIARTVLNILKEENDGE